MNINKLQAQLQHVPDQALIGYVQNPQGQVPSYLALAELTRRKEIRASAPAQQAPAPTQSVADQVVGESEGVSGLPLRDGEMFSEKSMATGGIVSFADGGGVGSRMYKGLEALTPAGAFRGVFGSPTAKSIAGGAAGVEQSYLDYVANALGISKDQAAQAVQENPNLLKGPYAPNMDPKAIAENEAAALRERFKPEPVEKPAAPVGVNTSGVGSLKWKPVGANEAGFDELMRPEVSAKDKMAEMQGLIGIDPARAAMADRLAKMEARTTKEEETAPWMALARAGLGMAAGKSQNAITNIAEGAGAGISDLAASKERINAAKDKQFEIANRMAQADRAEQVAAAKYGIESSEAIKARNDQTKLAKLGHKNQIELTNATQDFAAQKGNIDIAMDKAKLAQSASQHAQTLAMYRERIASQDKASQAKSLQIMAKISSDIDKSQPFLEQLNALKGEYKDKGGASNPEFQKRAADLKTVFMGNALQSLSVGAGSIPSSTDLLAD